MQISSSFGILDMIVFFGYFIVLVSSSYLFSRDKISSTKEYFTASNKLPLFAVAISIVATSQSAATFLGVPDYSYVHNFTLIGFYISALIAVVFVAKYFVPKFYEYKVVSVYELLEYRYGESAKQQAGIVFLLGRVMASGARLYIAAIAVSMILFFDINFLHMLFAILLLLIGALAYTYFGGIKSVVYSDTIQAFTYISAALFVMFYLYNSLDGISIYQVLQTHDKLNLVDSSLDGKFSIIGLLSGWLLLNIAAFGLDQDMTQRVLSCKDKDEASSSLILSILITIPIVFIFLIIGSLLFVYYQNVEVSREFEGEKITVFIYYILHELPDGIRGFVTVGAIAAALSSTNSVLGAMASVAIEDIYKPYQLNKGRYLDESHFFKASKIAVIGFAFLLLIMAVGSYFWQRNFDIPLISFALGVMAFTYTGLLGVFFSAIFTSRGSGKMVPFSLLGGFLTVLFLQPYVFGIDIGFAWQILIGSSIAFFIMQLERK